MAYEINNYELMAPFQNQNAGFSRWTKAKKEGRIYFIKEFMDPKYPDQNSLKESLRKSRIKECEAFETEKRNLYTTVNSISDGNLVGVEEFFRGDSRYYMVTPWMDNCGLSFADIAKKDLKDKLLLCRTAAHCLQALHSARIVHSDIKETNVIVHETAGKKLVAKIIDFDSSFFENNPPDNEDDLGGDQVYLSPEACLFFCGEDVKLTCKMDVFALGLLFHQYLTGELPYFDKNEYDYAHEAVLDDVVLKADTADIKLPIREVIDKMLLKDVEKRISSAEVYEKLTKYYKEQYPFESTGGSNSGRLRMSSDFFSPAGDL